MAKRDDDDESEEPVTEAVVRAGRWRFLPNLSPGPRDVRKGDRWLPWHGQMAGGGK